MKRFPLFAALTPLLLALPGGPAPAAPGKTATSITSPVAAAKTFQVTETFYNCGEGAVPGPLHLAGTMTFRMTRPDKFRVEMTQSKSSPPTLYVSDGKWLVYKEGKQMKKWPTQGWEWPYPLMGLLNLPGHVSVVPTVRGGREVLLAVRVMGPDGGNRVETLYDAKSHLPLEDTMFMTWQGKNYTTTRTVYTDWVLNKPFTPAMFKP